MAATFIEPINKDFSDGKPENWPKSGLSYRPAADYNSTVLISYPRAMASSKYQKLGTPVLSMYKRIFGHPSGRYYDSAIKFWPHFKWLMNSGQGSCECVLDSSRPTAAQPRKTREAAITANINANINANTEGSGSESASRFRARQPKPADTDMYDPDGDPDVFKNLLSGLRTRKYIDSKAIKLSDNDLPQRDSMDWVTERDSLATMLARYKLQPSFIPRVGELVLWVPTIDGDIILDQEQNHYKIFDFNTKTFKGFPDWRAGTVADVPEELIDFWDLSTDPKGSGHVSQTSGFRVETFPDPNDDVNKSFSKRYKYIRMRQIRPLSHWQHLLRGIPKEKIHPSVFFALTVMSSISLVEKFSMTGDQQRARATIYGQGVFIGSELLVVGDTICFTAPSAPSHCNNILVIGDIRLRLSGITSAELEPGRSTLLAPRSTIRLVGKAFTLDRSLSPDKEPITTDELINFSSVKGVEDYAPQSWYAMHGPEQSLEISYDRVIGRMPEFTAARYWQGISQSHPPPGLSPSSSKTPPRPSLSYSLLSIKAARIYSSQADTRIPSRDTKGWFWGDSRAETLALETLNGVEIGDYSEMLRPEKREQTYRQWRGLLKVARGEAKDSKEFADAGLPRKQGAHGRPKGSRIVDGKLVMPSKMVDAALETTTTGSSSDGGDDDDAMDAELLATYPPGMKPGDLTYEGPGGEKQGKPRGRKPGGRVVDGKYVPVDKLEEVQKEKAREKERSNVTPLNRHTDAMDIDRPPIVAVTVPVAHQPPSARQPPQRPRPSPQRAQPIVIDLSEDVDAAAAADDDADVQMADGDNSGGDDDAPTTITAAATATATSTTVQALNIESDADDADDDDDDPTALLTKFGGIAH
ncbi:MAG: hypothetical protein Q9160_000507 [Pyrenula sp. 1 TL-2023]